MAVEFDVAFDASGEGQDPLTSTSQTIAGTSDRWAILGGVKSDTGTFNGATIGSSMSVLESAFAIAYLDAIIYSLLSPSSGSQTASLDFASAVPDFSALVAAVYNGVEQTTPYGTPPAYTEGVIEDPATTGSATITGTTITDGRLVGVMAYLYSAGVAPTLVARTGTTIRAQARSAQWGVALIDRADNAGSTEVGVDITIAAASVISWRMHGYPLRPATAGPPPPAPRIIFPTASVTMR